MPLEFREEIVGSTEGKVGARVAFHCNQPFFYVYQVHTQTHFHLQCGVCDTSFCPGDCDAEEGEGESQGEEKPEGAS